jgi:hypothetical protein
MRVTMLARADHMWDDGVDRQVSLISCGRENGGEEK